MSLTHYIFVRRDLPIGTIAAMVTHAAGESAAKWAKAHNADLPYHTIAVVLEAKNEDALHEIREYLAPMSPTIECSSIHELMPAPTEMFPQMRKSELMAIGVGPISKAVGNVLFRDYQLLKSSLDKEVPSA